MSINLPNFRVLYLHALRKDVLSRSIIKEKKKKHFPTLVKMVKQPLFKTAIIGVGTTLMGFCSVEGRLGYILNTRNGGDIEPRSRVGSVHGKLVKGNIRGGVDFA